MLFVSSKKFNCLEKLTLKSGIETFTPWYIQWKLLVGGVAFKFKFCQGFIALILEMGFAVGSTFDC